jgi:hypothetical protein
LKKDWEVSLTPVLQLLCFLPLDKIELCFLVQGELEVVFRREKLNSQFGSLPNLLALQADFCTLVFLVELIFVSHGAI